MLLMFAACTEPATAPPLGTEPTDSPPADTDPPVTDTDPPTDPDPTGDTGAPPAPLTNRDRLIAGYLAYLDETPARAHSNGLRGADLDTVCDLWDALDPSSQATFLTIAARLDGSILADGSSMLDHVTTAYRIVGGEDASAIDPGSCGGAEFNRVIVSIDPVLHAALIAANEHEGEPVAGVRDLADIPAGGYWRNSEDLAGPHEPFTLSDETEDGAPRGQVHYFRDPASAVANSPLGRLDVEDLVDPYALEMDQDYDCVHSSNPLCEYTFYGPFCLPEPTALGFTIFTDGYGPVDAGWRPTGC